MQVSDELIRFPDDSLLVLVHVEQLQCFGRTDIDADRSLHVGAAITFQGDLAFRPGIDDAIWTEQRTGPAANTIIFLDQYGPAFTVTGQRPG